jgi:hypothetical protein
MHSHGGIAAIVRRHVSGRKWEVAQRIRRFALPVESLSDELQTDAEQSVELGGLVPAKLTAITSSALR